MPVSLARATTTAQLQLRCSSQAALVKPWSLCRWASKSSWTSRQSRDPYAKAAKVRGLKSRAAFKLVEINNKHKIFAPNQTVVDLGYAPGSWSQIALEHTRPHGLVFGVDLCPANPPAGMSAMQGDFLSPQIQSFMKMFIKSWEKKRPVAAPTAPQPEEEDAETEADAKTGERSKVDGVARQSYIDMERQASADQDPKQGEHDRFVHVVLSDMSDPWPQASGHKVNTLSNPYHRLANTSGIPLHDHEQSMVLCRAALQFASETLIPGGHFICKFYAGAQDRNLQKEIEKLFAKVHRQKPESSRSESKEEYFIGLRRKKYVTLVEEEADVNVQQSPSLSSVDPPEDKVLESGASTTPGATTEASTDTTVKRHT
ncbi:hypothetical protein N3K66_004322 [Trichothecium roseum]|uniref:Uncharacterized protein n=1 Tax=Trichothecium roseum TaxID=47278 RepID=A0ACC0V0Y1_9HYPO|nr:hypothetical protein N3K66_004322 [Trichothecium roseum]